MSESHFQQEGSFFEAQVLCFCTLAGIGMVLAGIYLEFVNLSGQLKYPSMLIMIPALIGLKGNIEMTLSSRISAIILAAVGGGAVAICAIILNKSTLHFEEILVPISVAIISSSLAAIFIGLAYFPLDRSNLGVLMLFVIYLCVQLSLDPDNVAAPLAAALGDIFVLLIMTAVVWAIDSVFNSPFPVYLGMLSCLGFAFGPALSYLRGKVSANCLAADYSTLTYSLFPLVGAIILSSASGWIFASYVDLLPNLSRLQPSVNGIGGNLASILISRMTTRLSVISKPIITTDIVDLIETIGFTCTHSLRVKESNSSENSFIDSDTEKDEQMAKLADSLKATEFAVCNAISDSSTAIYRLLSICLPLHSLLLVVNLAISAIFHKSAEIKAFSLIVIVAYLAAGFLQVFVLLIFARWLVLRRWLGVARRQQQSTINLASVPSPTEVGELAALDITSIALTTGLGDLVGTTILCALLHLTEGPHK